MITLKPLLMISLSVEIATLMFLAYLLITRWRNRPPVPLLVLALVFIAFNAFTGYSELDAAGSSELQIIGTSLLTFSGVVLYLLYMMKNLRDFTGSGGILRVILYTFTFMLLSIVAYLALRQFPTVRTSSCIVIFIGYIASIIFWLPVFSAPFFSLLDTGQKLSIVFGMAGTVFAAAYPLMVLLTGIEFNALLVNVEFFLALSTYLLTLSGQPGRHTTWKRKPTSYELSDEWKSGPLYALQLTPQQQRVAQLLLTGKKPYEIETILSLQPNTVRKHVSNIIKRVKCKNAATFVRIYRQYYKSLY